MEILKYMERYGFEQFNVYSDPGAGLRAFIAIHDTTLGPALGGCRVWSHKTEEEAILDVLQLARAMTYKSAAAGLAFGGGKALIMADPHTDKTEAMFRAFGRFVESLGGRYITTEDVGTVMQDMEWAALETSHIAGLPEYYGSSGDPSQVTGFGLYQGMKACAWEVWGTDSLDGRTVALQGFGKVAGSLTHHLLEEERNVRIIASDISETALEHAREHEEITVVDPEKIYDMECDIFAPCALGGTINRNTIPRLKCKIVCGGANNQLGEEDKDAERLQERNILYAPDFIVNAGGVINISCEINMTYDEQAAIEKASRIFDTVEQVISMAKTRGITTAKAADLLAEERIHSVRKARQLFLAS